MKIGLVVEHFDPTHGGLEHWSWQFVQAMVERGHEMHVLAQSFSPVVESQAIECHLVPKNGSRMAYAAALERRLATLDLDVVHDTGAGWRCDIFQPHFGSRAAYVDRGVELLPRTLRPGRRLAVRLLPRYREFQALAARQYVDDGRLFLALSEKVADSFVRYHGVRRDAIRVVYNGVDCQRCSPQQGPVERDTIRRELGVDADTLLLLTVAHNFQLKGVASAIKAVARLRRSSANVHLAVLGGGRPQRYRRLARSLEVASRVTFLGSRSDCVPYYTAADALVHPAYFDCCSLVVLEALACGLPVVSTRATGVDELMTDGREGYLLSDPGEIDCLADRLGRLLDASQREKMGRAARQLALAHSFAHNCDQIEVLYEEKVSGPVSR